MKISKITTYLTDTGFKLSCLPANLDDILVSEKEGKVYIRYLVQDDFSMPPNEQGDDSLFLVNYHRDFDVRNNKIITENEVRDYYGNNKLGAWAQKYWLFELNAYIHSGVVLGLAPTNFPDERWDVSKVGLVLVSKKEWKTEAKAEKAAESLVKEWNMYLSNDVWGLITDVFDAKTKERIENECESVWSCYGYDYCLNELKEMNK